MDYNSSQNNAVYERIQNKVLRRIRRRRFFNRYLAWEFWKDLLMGKQTRPIASAETEVFVEQPMRPTLQTVKVSRKD